MKAFAGSVCGVSNMACLRSWTTLCLVACTELNTFLAFFFGAAFFVGADFDFAAADLVARGLVVLALVVLALVVPDLAAPVFAGRPAVPFAGPGFLAVFFAEAGSFGRPCFFGRPGELAGEDVVALLSVAYD